MFWPSMRKEYQRVEDGTDALANDNSEAKPLPPPSLSYGVKAVAFTLRVIQLACSVAVLCTTAAFIDAVARAAPSIKAPAATDLMLVGSVFSTLGALLGINLILRGNSLGNPGIGMLDVISVIKFVIGGGIARVTFKGDTCTLYESLTYTPSWPHRLIARDGILTQACHLNLWAATIGYVACASIAVNIVWRHSVRRSSKPKKADWLLDDRQLEA